MKQLRVNERIRVGKIRVIGEKGEQLGLMAPQEALRLARESDLDLVEVAPGSDPPVCRIMDFNKFKYDEQRRERQAKHKRHVTRLKEVKFKSRIGEHDYQVKLGMLKRFLMRGDQAKVTMVYRGREMAHPELGRRVIERVVLDLTDYVKVERGAQMEGRMMTMILGPDREKIKKMTKIAARKKALADAATSGSALAASQERPEMTEASKQRGRRA